MMMKKLGIGAAEAYSISADVWMKRAYGTVCNEGYQLVFQREKFWKQ